MILRGYLRSSKKRIEKISFKRLCNADPAIRKAQNCAFRGENSLIHQLTQRVFSWMN